MIKISINFFLLILLFSNFCFAQQKQYSYDEIKKLNQLSNDYFYKANFEKSLITSKKALYLATVNNHNDLIAVAYNRIGRNFDELSEPEEAISFFKKALLYANESKNVKIINNVINNIGNTYYFTQNNYEKGVEYFLKSDSISRKINNKSGIVTANLNLTWVYFKAKKFEKGFGSLNYINKNNKQFGDKDNDVSISMLNGMYYSHLSNNKKADSCFVSGLKRSENYVLKDDKYELHKEYAAFLFKIKDFKNAYIQLENYNKIKSEFFNVTKLEKAKISGATIQIDEYKKEIDKIEGEKESSIYKLHKSRIILYLVLFVLLILILFLATLIKNNKLKKLSNSKLLEINEELTKAVAKADKASYLKSQFVSTITHELRTPLYGVVGMTNILIEENKNLKNNQHLNSLKFSATYLLSLVNDLLQINKIEEKKIILEFSTINLSEEIKTITKSLEFIAEKNHNTLLTEIDSKIPEFLIGDKLRLSQIFINLISNSLKFTTNGYVKVCANVDKFENSKCYIHFKIEDNGIGIAKKDQDKIYEKFYQIDRKESDYQGTGLGLSIVQKLLELFNSQIKLESEENKGSSFMFTIGFDTVANSIIETKPENIIVTDAKNYTILIVEDNKINQIVTRKILEKNNFKCTIVDDGYAAIELLAIKKFDLILMDINMPLINGYETTKIIRNKGNSIPIVALTAFDIEEIKDKVFQCGMNDIIIKPFESEKLFEILDKLFHKKIVD